MLFETINPATNLLVHEFKQHNWRQIQYLLKKADEGFNINRTSSFAIRTNRFKSLVNILSTKKQELAQLITNEMGKPIQQSIAEIEKCIFICNYYADNAKLFLKDDTINTENNLSLITYIPMGTILAVMPWNFPFWQVFRCAVPALMAGNTILLKPSPIVPQCAIAIENIFKEAGFPEGLLQTVFIHHNKMPWLLESPIIKALTFTGSEDAGTDIAELAGSNIKKMVLELGSNDPFIILDDANIKNAAEAAVVSAFHNAGQNCIAAKRFIVVEKIANDFTRLCLQHVNKLIVGDPLNENTTVGPLAREEFVHKIARQVRESIKLGAVPICGNGRPTHKGAYYFPTLLNFVTPGMPVFDEEVFGPVASIILAKDAQDAIYLANKTKYGLGASIWSVDNEKALRLARQIYAGAVYINDFVKSDPRLPFGGIKRSGFGRELSEQGIKEFTYIKTIVIK